ncbi:hypothetical protein [Streptomyces sp. OE57]|uniref:hypothetical protein n=1 Tax=Streptomyces lacaronensis TaxID=3379885 RepID=UPI0039B775C0
MLARRSLSDPTEIAYYLAQAPVGIYQGGQASRRLFQLSRELHHALLVLAERSPMPFPTCGDVFRQATQAGLLQ